MKKLKLHWIELKKCCNWMEYECKGIEYIINIETRKFYIPKFVELHEVVELEDEKGNSGDHENNSMKITITGRIPSKKNSRTIVCSGNRPRLLPNKSYWQWHDDAMWQVKKYRPKKPLELAEIEITIYNDTERRFDLNNSSQSILDLLVDSLILADDSAKNVPSLLMMYGGVDRKNPRAEITINHG